ncbi:hypothetical protein Cni_G01254 [Canna indica]|uniref:Protein kinase domain-containing protein n=1 Tax=Canna indica TaxID=4628 RepID=A0AAQ3JNV9_9LILI|nr:hypothetical protein Cni_G01254 [Canna indica]
MAVSQWCRGRVIGRGSTATVSLAAASPSGYPFAVKSAELSISAFLQREHSILSSLRHPNIVSCLGSDIAAEAPHGRLYYNLFLEYAPLGSLSDCIAKRGGRLAEAAVRSYAGDMLRGLAHLHANSIAHCDVKSRNVLVWPDGRAKLADLGCARSTAADGGTARSVAGTPMFMAPEVARGEEQGAAADVWAFGCTVIEMATGQPPWPDVEDPVAALHRIGFAADVPKCPSWLSEEAKDFVDKCLRRDARERWTAEQLLQHPFIIAKPSAETCFTESGVDQVWVSPKSTLEQGLWDSVADEEEEEEEEDVKQRIRQLAGDGSPASNWTWDDSWQTVRVREDDDDDELIISQRRKMVMRDESRGPLPLPQTKLHALETVGDASVHCVCLRHIF